MVVYDHVASYVYRAMYRIWYRLGIYVVLG
jgi:hypothetical protein